MSAITNLTRDRVVTLLPLRRADGHKGDFGHVFIIAGSPGFTGAPKLAAEGALRSGCGLVTLGISSNLVPMIVPSLLEAMWFPLEASHDGCISTRASGAAAQFASNKHAVVLGPGLSQTDEVKSFVHNFIDACSVPLLIDADGLNCVAQNPTVLKNVHAPCCITPHPGEMARLMKTSVSTIQKDRANVAASLAKDLGCVVVLKGYGTIIAAPSGDLVKNTTGNSGLATGGTGDILSGLIGGLMAQRLEPFDAACLGVFLHGLAGDIAALHKTQRGLIARDVVEAIPVAWARVEGSNSG